VQPTQGQDRLDKIPAVRLTWTGKSEGKGVEYVPFMDILYFFTEGALKDSIIIADWTEKFLTAPQVIYFRTSERLYRVARSRIPEFGFTHQIRSLEQLQPLLPSFFKRIHRSALINIRMILRSTSNDYECFSVAAGEARGREEESVRWSRRMPLGED
jgi:hypothetical protein